MDLWREALTKLDREMGEALTFLDLRETFGSKIPLIVVTRESVRKG